MLPRPPTFTLFPYTTLFRSPKEKRPISLKKAMHLVMRSLIATGQLSLLRHERQIKEIIQEQAKAFGVKVYRQANGGNHLDRKSTRLNSSHPSISYAVFCLKK